MVAGSVTSKLLVCEAESLQTRGSDEGLGEAGAGSDGDHCISNTMRDIRSPEYKASLSTTTSMLISTLSK